MIRRVNIDIGTVRRGLQMFALGACVVAATGMRPATTPADVRADSLLADIERALATGDPVTLDWKSMAQLNYKTGEMPASLKKLNGVQVRVPGFMVPLEDTETRVTEFLLVPYFGACIHVPPPPPNQIVYVTTPKGIALDSIYEAYWITGTMKMENKSTRLGAAAYSLSADKVEIYKY